MTVERKSTLSKAPADDVVAALTRQEETPRGPGPGRPRSKRRMEPFSSKIEIALRDELDIFLVANEMTIVDFLDEAIRDRLVKK